MRRFTFVNFPAEKRCQLGVFLLACLAVVVVIWYVDSSKTETSHLIHPKLLPYYKTFGSMGAFFEEALFKYNSHISTIEQHVFQKSGHVTLGPPPNTPVSNELNHSVKRILLWTEFFGNKQWVPELVCEGQNLTCVTSLDKNDLLKSDGVLMHSRDLWGLPLVHPPSQRWIYFVQESPYHVFLDLKAYNGIFNWTSTYRRDSDFPALYYNSTPLNEPLTDTNYRKIVDDIVAKKSKLIATAISNCNTPHSGRLAFIQELKKYVQVDFYGACGDMKCERNEENCLQLFSEYKFFIAFENSNCRDYITEKVHAPLHVYNSVPIVMGGAHPSDYEQLLPPNSYLHFQGFSSVKELADFILFLDDHPKYYEYFHRWRQTHEAVSRDYWCDICLALHNKSLPTKVYSDFEGWYGEDSCGDNVTIRTSLFKVFIFVFIILVSLGSFIFLSLYCKE